MILSRARIGRVKEICSRRDGTYGAVRPARFLLVGVPHEHDRRPFGVSRRGRGGGTGDPAL
jgi:hypothetical protein